MPRGDVIGAPRIVQNTTGTAACDIPVIGNP